MSPKQATCSGREDNPHHDFQHGFKLFHNMAITSVRGSFFFAGKTYINDGMIETGASLQVAQPTGLFPRGRFAYPQNGVALRTEGYYEHCRQSFKALALASSCNYWADEQAHAALDV